MSDGEKLVLEGHVSGRLHCCEGNEVQIGDRSLIAMLEAVFGSSPDSVYPYLRHLGELRITVERL